MRSEEEKGKRLAEKYGILMTKEMEVDRMCDLSQIFVDKGIEKGLVLGESKGKAEGKEESNVACVQSLSKHLSIRYEEAMDLLEIEETLRPSIRCRLSDQALADDGRQGIFSGLLLWETDGACM